MEIRLVYTEANVCVKMQNMCLKATEPLRGDSFLFTIQFPGFLEFLVVNWSPSKGWKAQLTFEPPSGYPLDWESSALSARPLHVSTEEATEMAAKYLQKK